MDYFVGAKHALLEMWKKPFEGVRGTSKFLRLQTLDPIFECNGMTLSSI